MVDARRREFKKLKRHIFEARIQQMQAQDTSITFDNLKAVAPASGGGFFGIPSIDTALPDGKIAVAAIHEFIPSTTADFPAALGFMICFIRRLIQQEKTPDNPILWCHTLGRAEFPSLPYLPGLAMSGTPPLRFCTVSTRLEKDMLWALEEGLSMACNSFIVGVNASLEKIYDFTASRRLSLRAARHDSRLLLLRPHTAAAGSEQGSTTAAATRWQISPHPSRTIKYRNAHTPTMGRPCWKITLTRCKGGKTGNWILEWDHETFSFHLAASLANRKPPAQWRQTTRTPNSTSLRQTGS